MTDDEAAAIAAALTYLFQLDAAGAAAQHDTMMESLFRSARPRTWAQTAKVEATQPARPDGRPHQWSR